MKQEYIVTAIDKDILDNVYVPKEAVLLMTKYGLDSYFRPEEVYRIWADYSESYCAGWLIDNPKCVEDAFGVKLEKLE